MAHIDEVFGKVGEVEALIDSQLLIDTLNAIAEGFLDHEMRYLIETLNDGIWLIESVFPKDSTDQNRVDDGDLKLGLPTIQLKRLSRDHPFNPGHLLSSSQMLEFYPKCEVLEEAIISINAIESLFVDPPGGVDGHNVFLSTNYTSFSNEDLGFELVFQILQRIIEEYEFVRLGGEVLILTMAKSYGSRGLMSFHSILHAENSEVFWHTDGYETGNLSMLYSLCRIEV